MVEPVLALAGIVGALLVGAISPGPSFVLVARIAIARSRLDGVAAAFGMGIGGIILCGLALLGLRTLLMQAGWLYIGLKTAGGLYLVYLGVRLWRGARETIVMPDAVAPNMTGPARSLALALATQLSNPKTIFVYCGIFAALLPAAAPWWMIAALPPLVFLVEAGWYSVVALAFSASRPRAAYLRAKRLIDRMAGAVIAALGLRLIIATELPS